MKVLPFSPPTYLVKMFASNRRSKQELVHILPFKCFYEKMAQFARRSTAAITHLAACWTLAAAPQDGLDNTYPYIHPYIHSYIHLHSQNCGYKADCKIYLQVSYLCSGGNPNTQHDTDSSTTCVNVLLLAAAEACRLYF